MIDLLQSFLNWFKDPFGRKEMLSRHAEVINEIHATQALVKETTQYFAQTHQGVTSANAIHRAMLGNRKE